MRHALVICFWLALSGCKSSTLPPLPPQPEAPTDGGIVATVSKEWDLADQKVAASVAIARENADKPAVVKAETTVALSFLPAPTPAELALARERAAKADQKTYTEATQFGSKLLASIDTNWLKVEAQQREALRVSALKDARIKELTAEVERVKQEASANLWTLAGVGCALIGAVTIAFGSKKSGISLMACGASIGAFSFIYDSPWFPWVAGITLVLAAGLGLWVLYDRARDTVHQSDEQTPKS